jgi:hypothetical protein
VNSAGVNIYSGGLTVTAGVSVYSGGMNIRNAGVTIQSGGMSVRGTYVCLYTYTYMISIDKYM